MTKFIMASNNPGKIRELDRILNPLGVKVVTAKSEGVELDDVEETGKTYAENARLKAMAAFEKTGLACIADDSGLSVDALGGAPGVYSARYAGQGAPDSAKIEKLLYNMKDIPEGKRSAHFVCTICCILDKDTIIEVCGTCSGVIGFEPKGDGGFGYDPVFLIPDGRSFAQLSAEEKDKLSHRGNALRQLSEKLSQIMNDENCK